jgi:hypothetical protein
MGDDHIDARNSVWWAWIMVLVGIVGLAGIGFRVYKIITGIAPLKSFWYEFWTVTPMLISTMLGLFFAVLLYHYYTYYQYELPYSDKYPRNIYPFPKRNEFKKLILRKNDTLDVQWFLKKAIDAAPYFHTPDPRLPHRLFHDVGKIGSIDLDFYGSILYTKYVQGNGWQIVFCNDPEIQDFFKGQGYYFVNSKMIVYGDLEQLENDLITMRLSM